MTGAAPHRAATCSPVVASLEQGPDLCDERREADIGNAWKRLEQHSFGVCSQGVREFILEIGDSALSRLIWAMDPRMIASRTFGAMGFAAAGCPEPPDECGCRLAAPVAVPMAELAHPAFTEKCRRLWGWIVDQECQCHLACQHLQTPSPRRATPDERTKSCSSKTKHFAGKSDRKSEYAL